MAGIITISVDKRWKVSNWVYWNFMDHVLGSMKEASNAALFVETCKWMQGLDIPLMNGEQRGIAVEVLTALKTAAENCSDGRVSCSVDGRVLDEASQREFRDLTGILLRMLETLP